MKGESRLREVHRYNFYIFTLLRDGFKFYKKKKKEPFSDPVKCKEEV